MSDDCKIYVGFLSYLINNESFKEYFNGIGDVVEGECFWKRSCFILRYDMLIWLISVFFVLCIVKNFI